MRNLTTIVLEALLAIGLVLPTGVFAACDDPPEAGVDWRHCDKQGADLQQANLQGAKLDEANLKGANLAGANLTAASLVRTILEDANLHGAKLGGANLAAARLAGATWIHGETCMPGSFTSCVTH